VREFLARNEVEHAFEDIRKAPVSKRNTIALVRAHRRAIAKRGAAVIEIDPNKATDEEILKLFLGREGTLRAPSVSVGDTLIAGFDAASFEKLLG
jgi:arsenate reductase-like glutaredoxin family protein